MYLLESFLLLPSDRKKQQSQTHTHRIYIYIHIHQEREREKYSHPATKAPSHPLNATLEQINTLSRNRVSAKRNLLNRGDGKLFRFPCRNPGFLVLLFFLCCFVSFSSLHLSILLRLSSLFFFFFDFTIEPIIKAESLYLALQLNLFLLFGFHLFYFFI